MTSSHLVALEEYRILQSQCDELVQEEGIRLAFLIYSTGQIIVTAGQTNGLDVTGLAALFAGSMAGASGISRICNEPDFSTMIYEGQREQVLMSAIASKGILIVHFDRARALGWVRFMVKKRLHIMAAQLESLKAKYAQLKSPMSEVSDEEIDDFDFGGF